jgi:hypothetical protein
MLEAPKPIRLAGASLVPGAILEVPVIMRYTGDGATTVNVFVVFREVNLLIVAVFTDPHAMRTQNESAMQYFVTRARRSAWVQPIILLNAVVRAAASSSTSLYSLMIEVSVGACFDITWTALVHTSDGEYRKVE